MNLDEEIAHYLAGLRVSDSIVYDTDATETVDGDKSKNCPSFPQEDFLHAKLMELKSKFQEMLQDPESRPLPGHWTEVETSSLNESYGPWIARVNGPIQPVRENVGGTRHLHEGADTLAVGDDAEIIKIVDDMNNFINNVLDSDEDTVDVGETCHLQMGDDILAVGDNEGINKTTKKVEKIIDDFLGKVDNTVDVAANAELEVIRGYRSNTSSERSLANEIAAKGEKDQPTLEGDGEEISKAMPADVDEGDWDDCDLGES